MGGKNYSKGEIKLKLKVQKIYFFDCKRKKGIKTKKLNKYVAKDEPVSLSECRRCVHVEGLQRTTEQYSFNKGTEPPFFSCPMELWLIFWLKCV